MDYGILVEPSTGGAYVNWYSSLEEAKKKYIEASSYSNPILVKRLKVTLVVEGD